MNLLRSGLHLLPIPFLGLQTLAYAMLADRPGRRPVHGVDTRRPKLPDRHKIDESAALAAYQMGCLAQAMSVGGFEVGAGRMCGCERSGDYCIKRLR